MRIPTTPAKALLWSLGSMTPLQMVVFLIAAYGVPAMLAVAGGFVVYASVLGCRACRTKH